MPHSLSDSSSPPPPPRMHCLAPLPTPVLHDKHCNHTLYKRTSDLNPCIWRDELEVSNVTAAATVSTITAATTTSAVAAAAAAARCLCMCVEGFGCLVPSVSVCVRAHAGACLLRNLLSAPSQARRKRALFTSSLLL